MRGGKGPGQIISYVAAPGAKVIVKGAETMKDRWQGIHPYWSGPQSDQMVAWQHNLSGDLFPDAYNPFALRVHRVIVPGLIPGPSTWDNSSVDAAESLSMGSLWNP